MKRTSANTLWALMMLGSIAFCQAVSGADRYQERLNKILTEYRSLPDGPDVERLVELDRELRMLVKELEERGTDGASKKYWRKEYEDIGLFIRHYSDALGYSGKLLVEAHNRNPESPYRNYTLFSTILGEGTFHGLGVMPNVAQAELYLKEFPAGPFAEDVYSILGYFYDDLSKVLRRLVENEKGKEDYKYDCFAPYITREPYNEQLHRAVSLAIANLKRAIAANPSGEDSGYRREAMASVKSGTSAAWHWCAD